MREASLGKTPMLIRVSTKKVFSSIPKTLSL